MRATITHLATSLFCLFLLAAPAFAETELSPQQLERLEALYDKILADDVTALSMDELREYFQLEFALSDGDEELAVARLRVHLYQWSQHHDQKMEDVVAQLKERPKPQFILASYQPFPNFGNFNLDQLLNIFPETFEGLDAVVLPDLVTLPNLNFNFTNVTQQLNGINQLTTFSAVQAGLMPPAMAPTPPVIPNLIGSTFTLSSDSVGTNQVQFTGPNHFSHLGSLYKLVPATKLMRANRFVVSIETPTVLVTDASTIIANTQIVQHGVSTKVDLIIRGALVRTNTNPKAPTGVPVKVPIIANKQ